MIKRFIKTLLITLIFIFALQIQCFADDEENEIIQMQEVWEELRGAGAEVSKEPSLNSRSAGSEKSHGIYYQNYDCYNCT